MASITADPRNAVTTLNAHDLTTEQLERYRAGLGEGWPNNINTDAADRRQRVADQRRQRRARKEAA